MLLEIRSLIHPSHLFPIYFMLITCFLAIITGVLTTFSRKTLNYLKWFAVYCVLSLIQTALCLLHYLATTRGKPFPPVHTISANVFMIAEFFIVFRYLHQSLYHAMAKKIIKWIQIIFPLICIAYWSFIDSFAEFAYPLYVLEAICIFPFCLYYYIEIFTVPYLLNLGQESPFWINTAMGFHFLVYIPLFMLSSFAEFRTQDSIHYMIILAHSSTGILYGIFIKAFLCSNPPKKIYRSTKYKIGDSWVETWAPEGEQQKR